MTREQALSLLNSDKSHDRLKASRFLARYARPGDLELIQRRLNVEPVSYIQSSLKNAISRLSNRPREIVSDPENEEEITEVVKKQIYSEAVEWVTGLLLHEIAAPLGLVKMAAKREFEGYDGSNTQLGFAKLDGIFNAIEQLKTAAAAPKPEEFNLTTLIERIAAEAASGLDLTKVSLEGPENLIINSDQGLVRLALLNGIKNACESMIKMETNQDHAVVVSWGQTDVSYYCVVWDRGVGLNDAIGRPFGIGQSNKDGHSGFGLSIALQAMEMIGGTVKLEPRPQGGAKFEARWERPL